jgi:choline dehydrogenase-like flavoprotein
VQSLVASWPCNTIPFLGNDLNRDPNTVVVVGTGPAAAAAIVSLTSAGVDVTVLDAGLPPLARGLTVRVKGVTLARLHRDLRIRNGDVTMLGDTDSVLFEDLSPGGLTNHWSCAVPRFSDDDFTDGHRAGEAFTWPIAYKDLAPWYDYVEPLLRISGTPDSVPPLPAGKIEDAVRLREGWQPVTNAAASAGQALIPVPYVYGARTTATLSGTVFNSYVRLIKPLRTSNHLTIRWGARVTGLEWSGVDKRVEAVHVHDVTSGTTDRLPCRAVVLAAGAVNTAKILLQSTSTDFPAGLGNAEGVLGAYLHDHPLAKLAIDVATPLPFHPAACLTRLPLDRTRPLYAAACLQWSGTAMIARSVLAGHPWRARSIGFNLFGTMAPSAEDSVGLDRTRKSTDGTPGLTVRMHYPPEAEEALVAARDQLLALLDAAGLKPRVQMWTIHSPGAAVHFAGTCRMHDSRRYGMLDRWSRLHAVRNVVVGDSAAFTTGPEKNPVLTAMALSARAAHRLVEDMRTGAV